MGLDTGARGGGGRTGRRQLTPLQVMGLYLGWAGQDGGGQTPSKPTGVMGLGEGDLACL